MDWFKSNPFVAALGAVSALLLLGGGWLLTSEMTRMQELQGEFEQKSSRIAQLEGNDPFPDQSNVDAAKRELEQAEAAIAELSKSLAVARPKPITPQQFQDELAKSMKELSEKAQASGVDFSDELYLGFEKYQNQIPGGEAVPGLLLQLRSIAAVVSTLISSKVVSIDSLTRQSVSGELPLEAGDKNDAQASEPLPGVVQFPSFTVSFVTSQPAFRLAFNRIMEITPPILIRKVEIRNSSTTSPAKVTDSAASTPAADQTAPDAQAAPAQIRPVLGTETLAVSLTLASAVPPGPSTDSSKQ